MAPFGEGGEVKREEEEAHREAGERSREERVGMTRGSWTNRNPWWLRYCASRAERKRIAG